MKVLNIMAILMIVSLMSHAQLSYDQLNEELVKFSNVNMSYQLTLSEPCNENGSTQTLDFFQCGKNQAIRTNDMSMEQVHLSDTIIIINYAQKFINWSTNPSINLNEDKLLQFGYSESQMQFVNATLKTNLNNYLLLIEFNGLDPYKLTIGYNGSSGILEYYELVYKENNSELSGKCLRIDFMPIDENPCLVSSNRFLKFTAENAIALPKFNAFSTSQIPSK